MTLEVPTSVFDEPYDESPVEVPNGWSGGGVRHTGGHVWARSWFNTPDGQPTVDSKYDEYLEIGYGEQLSGVSVTRHVLIEGQVHEEVIDERAVEDATDHELARVAQELMEKHS